MGGRDSYLFWAIFGEDEEDSRGVEVCLVEVYVFRIDGLTEFERYFVLPWSVSFVDALITCDPPGH